MQRVIQTFITERAVVPAGLTLEDDHELVVGREHLFEPVADPKHAAKPKPKPTSKA